MLSRAWRQRLGFTVAGGCSSARKAYSLRLHTTRPLSFLISTSGSEPRKPRRASSKSCVSSKGSASSTARFCARVVGVASFGFSAGPAIAARLPDRQEQVKQPSPSLSPNRGRGQGEGALGGLSAPRLVESHPFEEALHRRLPDGHRARQQDVPVVADGRIELQLRRSATLDEQAMVRLDGSRSIVPVVLRVEPEHG